MIKYILLAFLGVFWTVSLLKNTLEYRKNVAFHNKFKQEYDQEVKENNRLKTEVIKSGDMWEIEKTIRNKLNLQKSNEVAIIVPTPTAELTMPTPTPAPAYAQWARLFFKN
jgi:hypothetical protein